MIVAGFGFRAAAEAASLRAALEAAAAAAGQAPWMLAAPADKAESAEFLALAEALGLPVAPVAPAMLEAMDPLCLTRSAASEAARGVGSVAEAAALAAAGPGARLLGPRVAGPDGMATCALAAPPHPDDLGDLA